MAVDSQSSVVSVTPTITAGAYAAGNSVGGTQKVPKLLRNVGTGLLKSLTVVEKGTQKAPLTFIFFSAQPAVAYADVATPTISSADANLIVGQATVGVADYLTTGGVSVAQIDCGGIVLGSKLANDPTSYTVAPDNRDLWALVVTTGTPTYVTAADLRFQFGTLQD